MDCIGSHEAPDVLWGAAEIGGRWCASRRKLLEALVGDELRTVGHEQGSA